MPIYTLKTIPELEPFDNRERMEVWNEFFDEAVVRRRKRFGWVTVVSLIAVSAVAAWVSFFLAQWHLVFKILLFVFMVFFGMLIDATLRIHLLYVNNRDILQEVVALRKKGFISIKL